MTYKAWSKFGWTASLLLHFVRGVDVAIPASESRATSTTSDTFHVSTSLVIPCYWTDFEMLKVVLESVSNQTVMPDETIVIMSQDNLNVGGSTILSINFPAAKVGDRPRRRDSRLDLTSLRDEPANVMKRLMRGNGLPLELSLLRIPKLRILVRTGPYWAGHNRIYGIEQSQNETDLFFFFDCDDYMHPRRTEYLTRTFAEHKDLDAMIHLYTLLPLSQWYSTDTVQKFMADMPFPPDDELFPYSSQEMHDAMPFESYANHTDGEPSQNGDDVWYFPLSMKLPARNVTDISGANGWVSFRRRVLDKVKYPVDRQHGEDSLFNYRILRAGLNWNWSPLNLGLYLRDR